MSTHTICDICKERVTPNPNPIQWIIWLSQTEPKVWIELKVHSNSTVTLHVCSACNRKALENYVLEYQMKGE